MEHMLGSRMSLSQTAQWQNGAGATNTGKPQGCPPEGVRYEGGETWGAGELALFLMRNTQNFPDAVPGGDFARASAWPIQPRVEIFDRHRVLDGDVGDGDAGDVESIGDAGDPVFTPQGGHPQCHRLVKRRGGDLDGVVHALHILDGDAARADGHGRECSSFAFCSP